MANETAPLEFTGGERETVSRLALIMKGVAAVLLLLATINVAGGAMVLLSGSPTGILAIIEGLITGLLGLIMVASAADVRFLVETKFTSTHLGNAFQDLTVFYKVVILVAIPVAVIRLLIG
jgi:hypothetical protein